MFGLGAVPALVQQHTQQVVRIRIFWIDREHVSQDRLCFIKISGAQQISGTHKFGVGIGRRIRALHLRGISRQSYQDN